MTAASSEGASSSASYARLHITPLDADLIKNFLSAALLPKARNISYHSIETFPEKRYGFLDLPSDDAERLRKKLNGAVLKGVKIRIERARPLAISTPLGETAMARHKDSEAADGVGRPGSSKAKKRKRDAELEGVVLEEGRKVKRGWATADEPKDKERRLRKEKKEKRNDKKKQSKSKYTDHDECLVKTVLPANTLPSTSTDDNGSNKNKNKRGKSREVVIHEFERTTKFPTFLKTAPSLSQPQAPLEFVDGKGWVDQDRNLVEAVKVYPALTPEAVSTKQSQAIQVERQGQALVDSSGESSDTDNSSDGEESEEQISDRSLPGPSTIGLEDAKVVPHDTVPKILISSPSLHKPDASRPKSSGSLTIRIPPNTPKDPKVHPLEALYKRPKQTEGEPHQELSEPKAFSFFNDAHEPISGEGADQAPENQVPMTPFTRQEFEWRGLRSAAPTPDTAHPSRRFSPWEQEEDAIEEDDNEDNASDDLEGDRASSPSKSGVQAANRDNEESANDFQKWFWENRGDINRAWRKRRKAAGKEKRHRENRARLARAI